MKNNILRAAVRYLFNSSVERDDLQLLAKSLFEEGLSSNTLDIAEVVTSYDHSHICLIHLHRAPEFASVRVQGENSIYIWKKDGSVECRDDSGNERRYLLPTEWTEELLRPSNKSTLAKSLKKIGVSNRAAKAIVARFPAHEVIDASLVRKIKDSLLEAVLCGGCKDIFTCAHRPQADLLRQRHRLLDAMNTIAVHLVTGGES
jgi:hypothetical protein